jgi:hypothetical protein
VTACAAVDSDRRKAASDSSEMRFMPLILMRARAGKL